MRNILKKNIKAFIVIGLVVIMCSALNSLHPYVLKEIINLDFLQNDIIKQIFKLVIIYSTIHILYAVFKNIRNIIVNKTVAKLLMQMRSKLFDKVLNLKLSTFQKYTSADIYTRLTVDIDNMATLFSDTLPVIVNESLYLVFTIIMMFQANFQFALIGFASIVIIAITVTLYVIKLKKIDDTILEKRDLQNKGYAEMYDTNKLTYLFNLR